MTALNPIVESGQRRSAEIAIVSKLRGFAAMSVFLFHVVCVSTGYFSDGPVFRLFSYGKYGVQFFFVISGFVITYSMLKGRYTSRSFFTFLEKRIIRIEPPYLVVVLLTVAFLYLRQWSGLGSAVSQPPGLTQVLLHIGYLIPFSSYDWLSIVFWTLAIEFQFYFLFSIIFKWYTSNQWLRWLIDLIFLLVFFNHPSEAFFFHWSPVFLLGINLALFKMKLMSQREFLISALLLALAVWWQTGWEVLVFALVPFALIYFDPAIKSRFWEFFGKISYSLYLCHTLVAFAILNIGLRFASNIFQKSLFVLIAIGSTVMCSYLLYYFVERPFKRIASSIKYKV